MTIVNRWYNILEKMVSQPTYSLVDMRSELDISMQTLQKSIQQLNDVLAPSIQIISQDDQLMLEVYDYTELERILSGSLKRESDFNSSSKRIAYLLKRLIESTSPLLIDDLAEEAGVSRSTLNKDLKQVKSLAELLYHYFRKAQPWAGGLGVRAEFALALYSPSGPLL